MKYTEIVWKQPEKEFELCDICGASSLERTIVWDHCHIDGDRIRGRLCQPCNIKMAWLEKHGVKAITYLNHPPRNGSYREKTNERQRIIRTLNIEEYRIYKREYETMRRAKKREDRGS